MCIWSKITWEVCDPVARRLKRLAGDQENPSKCRGSGKYKETIKNVKDVEIIQEEFFKTLKEERSG